MMQRNEKIIKLQQKTAATYGNFHRFRAVANALILQQNYVKRQRKDSTHSNFNCGHNNGQGA
jgi:hypothetical protein